MKYKKGVLYLFITLLISSCASNYHNLTNRSYIEASTYDLSLNGKKLEKLNGVIVKPETQIISFNGEVVLMVSADNSNKNSVNSAVCILLLPLCIVDALPKTKSNTSPYRNVFVDCSGSIEFLPEKGNEYYIKLKNEIDSMPKLVIMKNINNQILVEESELDCSKRA